MGHSVLLIPVPALEAWVRARWAHYEPAWVSGDPTFTHAHVTLLSPYLPEPAADDLAAVAAIAAATPPFGYRLEAVAAFPHGVIHVPPVPAAPFTALTARLVAAFPQCPPYAGAFGSLADLVPHVTLDHHLGGVTTEAVAADLAGLLPVAATADRIELHWYGEGECRVLERWPLGGRAQVRAEAGSSAPSSSLRSSKRAGRP